MKKYFLLLSVFALCTVYIFYTNYNKKEEQAQKGDPPILQWTHINLGGTVEKPKNDPIRIGKLQTSYIMYTKGDITFDQMVQENIMNLRGVLNYPFNPKKGYLFSVGYDDNSKVQFYYQSNQEETRTVILRVSYHELGNNVKKIYDGGYFKLVSVDMDNPEQLLAYDQNSDEFIIAVD